MIEISEMMLNVEYIYIPYLGKCEVFKTFDLEKDYVYRTSLNILKSERKDHEGTRYDLSIPDIAINFKDKTIKGLFYKIWIGGSVEKINFNYDFEFINFIKNLDVKEFSGFDFCTTDIKCFEH